MAERQEQRDGALFRGCITPNLVCQPSRASILTGLLPRTHGVCDNGIDLPRHFADSSFAALLAKAGYDTALTTRGGRARGGQDLFTLPRLEFVNSLQLAICLAKPSFKPLWRARRGSA